ncbi:MAG: hypothetical protein WCC48_00325 [Anaeromyxobacteraceae bacterium]
MSPSALRWTSHVALPAGVLAAIGLLEYGAGGRGALLVTLVFWTAIAQGSVAVVAVTDLTGARWGSSVKRELLVAAQLLPVLAALFLLLWPRLELYPWTAAPGRWLNRPFFMARGVALLLAAAVVARAFARRSLRGAPETRPLAVAYLILFAACQTLVAFDWVMSLSYPWVSSMFGMYFSVEALYAGLAAAGLIVLSLDRDRREREPATWAAARRDLGLLQFGFSVLWGGLFFAQFMLLWYGNLPEEVGFIAQRIAASPTRELAVLFLAACFGLPFIVFLSAGAKRSARAIGAVSVSILAGLIAEKLLLILPAVPLHHGVLAAEILVLLGAWVGAARLQGGLE